MFHKYLTNTNNIFKVLLVWEYLTSINTLYVVLVLNLIRGQLQGGIWSKEVQCGCDESVECYMRRWGGLLCECCEVEEVKDVNHMGMKTCYNSRKEPEMVLFKLMYDRANANHDLNIYWIGWHMYFYASLKTNQLIVSWSFVKAKGKASLRVVKSVVSWNFNHWCREVHVTHARTCVEPLSVDGDEGAKRWFINMMCWVGFELVNFIIDYKLESFFRLKCCCECACGSVQS